VSRTATISAALGLTTDNAFVGMRRNGQFYWVDQTAVDYTHWAPGEPNNYEGVNQNCFILLPIVKIW